MKITQENNFGRVFELPNNYPQGYLFGGGKPVQFQMVDWFNACPTGMDGMPDNSITFEEWSELIQEEIKLKNYYHSSKKYIMITDFGWSVII